MLAFQGLEFHTSQRGVATATAIAPTPVALEMGAGERLLDLRSGTAPTVMAAHKRGPAPCGIDPAAAPPIPAWRHP
ncbi:MAG: hypothetical protein ACKO0M_04290 [Cyanobium sp.]